MNASDIPRLTDVELLRKLENLNSFERTTLVTVLHCLREMNRRRLYSAGGFRSAGVQKPYFFLSGTFFPGAGTGSFASEVPPSFAASSLDFTACRTKNFSTLLRFAPPMRFLRSS